MWDGWWAAEFTRSEGACPTAAAETPGVQGPILLSPRRTIEAEGAACGEGWWQTAAAHPLPDLCPLHSTLCPDHNHLLTDSLGHDCLPHALPQGAHSVAAREQQDRHCEVAGRAKGQVALSALTQLRDGQRAPTLRREAASAGGSGGGMVSTMGLLRERRELR